MEGEAACGIVLWFPARGGSPAMTPKTLKSKVSLVYFSLIFIILMLGVISPIITVSSVWAI